MTIGRGPAMDPESFVKLNKLTTSDDEPLEDIVQRIVSELGGLRARGTFELRVLGEGDTNEVNSFSMRFTPAGTTSLTERVKKPTFVAISTHEAFRTMVQGSYSPLQAYLDGPLKLQGNVQLGRQIIQHLAGLGTETRVCPVLFYESYSPVDNGGSLTLRGDFFTDGGTVEIVYNYGGSIILEQTVTADGSGNFTVTETGLPCGDMLDTPGVGVIVTATDLSTGKSTTQGLPTPC